MAFEGVGFKSYVLESNELRLRLSLIFDDHLLLNMSTVLPSTTPVAINLISWSNMISRLL